MISLSAASRADFSARADSDVLHESNNVHDKEQNAANNSNVFRMVNDMLSF